MEATVVFIIFAVAIAGILAYFIGKENNRD